MAHLYWMADIGIGIAQIAIPAILLYHLFRRGAVVRQFTSLVVTFGLLMTSCAATRFLDAALSRQAVDPLQGMVKILMVVTSWLTLIVIVRLVPFLMELRSPEELEAEVRQRTTELQQVNITLRATVAENERLVAELADRDQKKNQWLAMLAHELRNPLSPIMNAITLMRMSGSGGYAPLSDGSGCGLVERQRKIVERQVGNMARLIEDLLDISRITQGRIELAQTHTPLCEIVRHAVDAARPAMDAKEQRHVVGLPDQQIIIRGDPVRLEQVFVNLLTNAAKYTQAKGEINVSVRREPHGWATITVRDNGIGIPREVLPRIFDLFSQEDASLDRRGGGLGLGLTLAKSLVEHHGGRIEAYSAGRNQGSEFQVWLPAVDAAGMEAALPGLAAPLDEVADRSRMILIVEDNEDGAASLAELCELWGHRTTIAHDGWQAEERAREHAFDTVLLDIGLPGRDGCEVARRLRQMPSTREAMMIAVTGYGSGTLKDRWRDAGFDMQITKPMNPDQLRRILAGEIALDAGIV